MIQTTIKQRSVHKSKDDYGSIEVIDEGQTRSLYFGTRFKQSCMLLNDPNHLVLDYTCAMLAPLSLLKSSPENILVCGLGGGSQVKFLNANFPEANIDIIELRDSVIKIAIAYFSLNESGKINFFTGHAHVLSNQLVESKKKYDLILLDIFTGNDISADLKTNNLLSNCKRLLSETGFCTINLWKRSHGYKNICTRIRNSFPHHPFIIPIPGKENIIHFGFNEIPDKSAINRSRHEMSGQENNTYSFLVPYLDQLAGNLNPVTRLAHKLFGLV